MLIPLKELIKNYGIKPRGVIHVGGNTGQELADYYANGVEYSIWVEAIPEVYERLAANAANYPCAMCFNACIGEVDGKEVEFNISSNDGESSSVLELGLHTKYHPTVTYIDKVKMKAVRMDTLLSACPELEYNFLNIDVQGAELSVMKSFGESIAQFESIYTEVNSDEVYIGCCRVEQIDEYLAKYGFERVATKWTGAKWGDALYTKCK